MAHGAERGARLLVAKLREEPKTIDAILNELGECWACYRFLTQFLLSGTDQFALESYGGNRQRATEEVEKGVTNAQAHLARVRNVPPSDG